MLRRTYATYKKQHTHAHYGLHPWPNLTRPAPHHIFDCECAPNHNRAHVRLTYRKYVKLYHPDLSCSNEVVDELGNLLLTEEKLRRFSEIKEAYENLCNSKSHVPFSRYLTHQTDPPFDSSYNSAYSHQQRKKYYKDQIFQQAGTWEEFYRMKYDREPPTMAEIEANKWKILKWVAAFVVVYTVLYILVALEHAKDYDRQTRFQNMRANAHLMKAYDNHGQDTTQLERVKRFLVHRNLSLPDEERRNAYDEASIKFVQRPPVKENGKTFDKNDASSRTEIQEKLW